MLPILKTRSTVLIFSLAMIWGQFHQHIGAKLKCARRKELLGIISFDHQQNFTKLYRKTQLEVTAIVYALCSMYARKISLNLPLEKLLKNIDEINPQAKN